MYSCTGRAKGLKADGVRFAETLGRSFCRKTSMESGGSSRTRIRAWSFCQTDFVLALDGFLVIVECKLTWKIEAEVQLLEFPCARVVSLAEGRSVRCVVVCKNLLRGL